MSEPAKNAQLQILAIAAHNFCIIQAKAPLTYPMIELSVKVVCLRSQIRWPGKSEPLCAGGQTKRGYTSFRALQSVGMKMNKLSSPRHSAVNLGLIVFLGGMA